MRNERTLTSMGWRLAEEIAWARPERPGPEWWTLMDIAQDANDDTRQGWPGREYLSARAKKSARTIDRYIDKLVNGGLLKCVKAAAPGRRPVWEVPPLFDLSTTCDTDDDARTNDTNGVARPIHNVRQNGGQRATENSQRATPFMSHPPSLPPSLPPSTTSGPVVTTSVEGNGLSTGQRMASMQAARARRERKAKENT